MTRSTVYLRRSVTGKLVHASLWDTVTDGHLKLWSTTWRPAMAAHCAGRSPLQDKPEDSHWDWQAKIDHWRPLLAYHSFAIVCARELQGLMLAQDIMSARLPGQAGKAMVYVEYLATAPWNRSEISGTPRYQGVGTVLMASAIQLSLDLGYKGRIALHALSAAEGFYRDRCGMIDMGPDSNYHDLRYFEMTEVQAAVFRQERGTK